MEIPVCGNDLPKQLICLVGERVPPRLVEGLLVVVADKDETVLLHLLKRVPDLLFGEVWEELGEGGGTATGPVALVVVVGFVRRVLGDQGVDVLQKDCLADAVLAGDAHVEAVAQGDVLGPFYVVSYIPIFLCINQNRVPTREIYSISTRRTLHIRDTFRCRVLPAAHVARRSAILWNVQGSQLQSLTLRGHAQP